MFDKLKVFLDAFKQGKEIANASYWKGVQADSAKLAAVLYSLVLIAKQFGYDTGIDEGTTMAVGGGIFAIVNFILTNITSKRVGVDTTTLTFDTVVEPIVTEAIAPRTNPQPKPTRAKKRELQPTPKAPVEAPAESRGRFDGTTDA